MIKRLNSCEFFSSFDLQLRHFFPQKFLSVWVGGFSILFFNISCRCNFLTAQENYKIMIGMVFTKNYEFDQSRFSNYRIGIFQIHLIGMFESASITRRSSFFSKDTKIFIIGRLRILWEIVYVAIVKTYLRAKKYRIARRFASLEIIRKDNYCN